MSPLQALAQVKRLIITEESDESEINIEVGMDADDEYEPGQELYTEEELDEFRIYEPGQELYAEEEIEDFRKTSYGNFFSEEESLCETLQEIVIV
jgi:hypothetical protein